MFPFTVRKGEIVCIAGIDGNGQSELVYALTGLLPIENGQILLAGKDITKSTVRKRNMAGMSHIPEDRHKDGLVLDYNLSENLMLKRYFTPEFQHNGFIKFDVAYQYAEKLINEFDIRSGQAQEPSYEACPAETSRRPSLRGKSILILKY